MLTLFYTHHENHQEISIGRLKLVISPFPDQQRCVTTKRINVAPPTTLPRLWTGTTSARAVAELKIHD